MESVGRHRRLGGETIALRLVVSTDDTQAVTKSRLALVTVSTVCWLVGFLWLARTADWKFFAVAGPALMLVALATDEAARKLLRPSKRSVIFGLLGGVLMLAATQAGFLIVSRIVPSVVVRTEELYELLNVAGFSAPSRATLVLLVATSEEVIFRGSVAGAVGEPPGEVVSWCSRAQLVRILVLALVYGLTTVMLGNELLILCAFLCGIIWGAVRIATRSLVAPILVHLIWDLGVLIIWPLA